MAVRISRRDRAAAEERRGMSEVGLEAPYIEGPYVEDGGTGKPERRRSVTRHDLEVVRRPIESVRVKSRNTRKHPPEQIDRIAESIKQFGFAKPVLIDE